MTQTDVIRAWKDEEYRHGLTEAERTLLPAHPAGIIELAEGDLADVGGGFTILALTVGFYGGYKAAQRSND